MVSSHIGGKDLILSLSRIWIWAGNQKFHEMDEIHFEFSVSRIFLERMLIENKAFLFSDDFDNPAFSNFSPKNWKVMISLSRNQPFKSTHELAGNISNLSGFLVSSFWKRAQEKLLYKIEKIMTTLFGIPKLFEISQQETR